SLPTVSSIQTFTNYNTSSNPANWHAGDTVKLSASATLVSATSINALVLNGSSNTGIVGLGQAGNNLTLTSGALLTAEGNSINGSVGANIGGGTLQFGAGGTGEAIVMGYSPGFVPGV